VTAPRQPLLANYPPDALLDVTQVAGWLGVSEKTVGRLPIQSCIIGKRLRRWRVRDVREYIERMVTT
jgi:predicted DNA-binding transcriptional regulator AlpA